MILLPLNLQENVFLLAHFILEKNASVKHYGMKRYHKI